MVMGLGIFTPLGIAAAIYFMIHNMLAKTSAFLVSGVINRLRGSFDLLKVGGLYRDYPLLAVLFMIPAFALAGLPPLPGFFAKLGLVKAGIDSAYFGITAVALYTALLTLYSMVKIWAEAFLTKDPNRGESSEPEQPVRLDFQDVLPPLLLGVVIILMGLFANTVLGYTLEAAETLIDPAPYIDAVLKGGAP